MSANTSCRDWMETESGVEAFCATATADELLEAMNFVRAMSGRYAGKSEATSRRLADLARQIEAHGIVRFGKYFGCPF